MYGTETLVLCTFKFESHGPFRPHFCRPCLKLTVSDIKLQLGVPSIFIIYANLYVKHKHGNRTVRSRDLLKNS